MSKSRNRLVTNNKYKEEENTYYHKPQNNFNISVLPRCCWRLDLNACVVAFNRNQVKSHKISLGSLVPINYRACFFLHPWMLLSAFFIFKMYINTHTKPQQNNINKNKKGIWDLKNKIFSNLAYLSCPRFHLSRTTGFNSTKLGMKHQR